MNPFIVTTRKMINLQGRTITYSTVVNSAYNPDTSQITSVTSDYIMKAYHRHVRENQYAYPNLVGKDVVQFYVMVEDLPIEPKPQDIIYDGLDKFTVSSYQKHEARGEPVFYKIIAIRG